MINCILLITNCILINLCICLFIDQGKRILFPLTLFVINLGLSMVAEGVQCIQIEILENAKVMKIIKMNYRLGNKLPPISVDLSLPAITRTKSLNPSIQDVRSLISHSKEEKSKKSQHAFSNVLTQFWNKKE